MKATRTADGQTIKGRTETAHNSKNRAQDRETHTGKPEKRIQMNCTKAQHNSMTAEKPPEATAKGELCEV
jgi:hypothetical protein